MEKGERVRKEKNIWYEKLYKAGRCVLDTSLH